MKVKCQNHYMQRTSAFPLQVSEKLLNELSNDLDVLQYLKNDKDVSFEKFLLAISIANRQILISDLKEIKNKEILIKYLIRMSSRPTPFGLFAQVSFSKFSDKEENFYIDPLSIESNCSVSRLWLNKLIIKLEKKYLKDLCYIKNSNVYLAGDRLYNPNFTNRGSLTRSEKAINSVNVKNTKAVQRIRELTSDFNSFTDLYELLKKEYVDLDLDKFASFITTLIENEIIYSNLSARAYDEDPFLTLIKELQKLNTTGELLTNLEEIYNAVKFFVPSLENIEIIYKMMSNLQVSTDYIVCNSTLEKFTGNLSKEVKSKIESFLNKLSKIYVEKNNYPRLKLFKQEFFDYFEPNTLVPLKLIIDERKFNGLKYLTDTSEELSERETRIQTIIDQKILRSIKNQSDVVFFNLEDFAGIISEFPLNEEETAISIDLNFSVFKNNGIYNIYVGPNHGALKQGNSFQRFKGIWKKDFEESITQSYKSEIIEYEKLDDLVVDAFEVQKFGKANNILNMSCNYPTSLVFGTIKSDNDFSRTISIDDLFILLDDNLRLHIVDKSELKRVRLVSDSMLTPFSNGKLVQLLKEITYEYENHKIIERLNTFNRTNYFYTPRIVFEGVTLFLETWRINQVNFDIKDFNVFECQISKLISDFSIPNIVYLCKWDNRLLIDLNKKVFREILFKAIKKGDLSLQTPEDGLIENSIFEDSNTNRYATEFVTSVIFEKDVQPRKKLLYGSMPVYYAESVKNFSEDGWMYFNIYGVDKLGKDFYRGLSKLLFELNSVAEISWFYINYSDDLGKHIRLRFKSINQLNFFNHYRMVCEFLNNCCKSSIINKWLVMPYNREVSRYGGEEILGLCEELFYLDSEINLDSIINKDTYGTFEDVFFNLAHYLFFLTDSLQDSSNVLEKYFGDDLGYRKDYRRNSKKLKVILSRANDRVYSSYFYDVLQKLKQSIEIIDEVRRESIILSILHMHCNRSLNNLEVEKKLHHYLKFAVWDLISKNKKY